MSRDVRRYWGSSVTTPVRPVRPPVPWGAVFLAVLRRLAPLLLLGGAVAAGLTWVRSSRGFAVTEVRLAGCSDADRTERLVALTGALGTNLFALDLDQTRARLLADPWVAEAVLRRVPPSTLSVRAVERVPVVWHEGPKGHALLDVEGGVLETAPERTAHSLPGMSGPLAARPLVTATLVALRAAVPELAARITLVDVLPDGALRLVAEGEPEILLAGPASVDEVAGWLETAAALRRARGEVLRVDARYEGRLFLTPART